MNNALPFTKHRGTDLSDLDTGMLEWLANKAAHFDGYYGDWVKDRLTVIAELIHARSREGLDSGFELNDSQVAAVDAVTRELLDGPASAFRLEGGAGYGKSFTVKAIVAAALDRGYQVFACATSYVATQVLASQLPGLTVRTIASLLRLAKVEMEDREEYELTSDSFAQLSALLAPKMLLIVDEYSMVSDEIGQPMLDALANGGKLLAVGDLKQLPPVKQHRDSVLSTIPGSVELTKPMRYSEDSDLYRLEQAVRHEGRLTIAAWEKSRDVTIHDNSSALLDAYVADSLANPRDNHRVLFFRRTDVLAWNQAIRERFFGDDAAAPICDNEKLMVMNTGDAFNGRFKEDGNPDARRFYSGTNLSVENVREGEAMGIPCYLVRFEGTDDHEYPVVFASGASHTMAGVRGSEEFQDALAELHAEALETGIWSNWRAFKNAFVQVGYNYAMTVHRCQGQTVDRVYFIPARLEAGHMTSKLLYVAPTRARKAVHMARG